jgi:hypothetical protein
MREVVKLRIYPLSEINNLKIHGRTSGGLSPLTLFWTGSALELNVSGSELWFEIESSYGIMEPWACTVINSCPVSRQMLTAGRYWLCIFRGMNGNEIKNVRFLRESQAMNGDPECCLQIHAVKTDGDFLPVEEKPLRIEFIGDSITSGEGSVGAKSEVDWIPIWFSAYHNYTRMTAEALNADYRVISESGWGVYTGWDNNPHSNIPEYYEKVCGIITGEKNRELGAYKENDFSSWQPDVIVVNLGTNDGGAFNNPAWGDELTGESCKQHLEEDGSFRGEDIRAFEAAVKGFLAKLRHYNPKARIIWAYGMLGLTMMPAICRAVKEYIGETGDDRVFVLELPDTTEETIGSRMHPGELSHKKAAEVLTGYIRELIGIRKHR